MKRETGTVFVFFELFTERMSGKNESEYHNQKHFSC